MTVKAFLWKPEYFGRSCVDCRKHLFQENGKHLLNKATGLPLLRPAAVLTPCIVCPKIPEGAWPHWSRAIEFDQRSVRALEFFLECRAVRSFPEDPIVRAVAAVVVPLFEQYEKEEQRKFFHNLRFIQVQV